MLLKIEDKKVRGDKDPICQGAGGQPVGVISPPIFLELLPGKKYRQGAKLPKKAIESKEPLANQRLASNLHPRFCRMRVEKSIKIGQPSQGRMKGPAIKEIDGTEVNSHQIRS